MMNRFVFVAAISLLLLTGEAKANNTNLFGHVDGAGDIEISVLRYHDYVSMETEVIASQTINNDGSFNLNFFLSQTQLLMIRIGFKEASLFVEPGSDMEVGINYNNKVDTEQGPFPFQRALDMIILNQPDNSVNKQLYHIDSVMGKIIPEYKLRLILYQRNYQLYDSLKKEILNANVHSDSEFVNTYVRCYFAQLETYLYSHNLEALGEQFLADEVIHYEHPTWMQFFKSFVKMYVPDRTDYISPGEYEKCLIAKNSSYRELDNLLGKDTVFRNEQQRELAAIVLLMSEFDRSNFYQQDMIDFMNQLKKQTKFQRHRDIITRLEKQLQYDRRSSKIKDFVFFDEQKQDSIRFSDFRGRYLLVSFYQTKCMECLLELDIMEKLYNESKHDIYLLSVYMDEDKQQYEDFLRPKDYGWPIVHFGYQYDIVRHFDLVSIPSYLLVDPEGKIIDAYFPQLQSGGLNRIERLLKKE
ncbi:MAG: TlpA disulfide reductase family protein [Bacteroidales bacterium]